MAIVFKVSIPDEHKAMVVAAYEASRNRDKLESDEVFLAGVIESQLVENVTSYEQHKAASGVDIPADLVTVTVEPKP